MNFFDDALMPRYDNNSSIVNIEKKKDQSPNFSTPKNLARKIFVAMNNIKVLLFVASPHAASFILLVLADLTSVTFFVKVAWKCCAYLLISFGEKNFFSRIAL